MPFKITSEDKRAEKLLNEILKMAKFTVGGRGPFTVDEAVQECLINKLIYGVDLDVELIPTEVASKTD